MAKEAGEVVELTTPETGIQTTGTAGLNTQMPGQATTVSAFENGQGGMGNQQGLVQPDVDEMLFQIKSDDTPLMQLMLKSKSVSVKSPVVDHYQIDQGKAIVEVSDAVVENTNKTSFPLPLGAEDVNIPRVSGTIMFKGIDGYRPDGKTKTPGRWLMAYITGNDPTTGYPICTCINGPKKNSDSNECTVPAIAKGTQGIICANALYETQKEVEPSSMSPKPFRLYLQKSGMNQIVSDYFESQRKRIPFAEALIAEHMVSEFKREQNRKLWIGVQGMKTVRVPKLGEQNVYFTEGIRWQFKREMKHTGKWTVEQLIALCKMYFTGEDCPKTGLLLAGKNLLEQLQCIDYSKHPEIQITTKINPVGWEVTNIHTVFGDIEIKREPTLDTIGLSNSGAILGENRLVHYKRVEQHEFTEKVEGEEATRKGLILWDALGLKGACHLWIDGGDEEISVSDERVLFEFWDSTDAPATSSTKSAVYYLMQDCTAIDKRAKTGTMWQHNGTSWEEYKGAVFAG